MVFDKKKLLVYAVTDRELLGENFYFGIEEALKGGIKILQLREKKLCEKEFLETGLKLRDLCDKYHALLIINDNVEIAIKCKADGIHIGQSDMEIKKARKIIGDKMILGMSCENINQAIFAERDGADYLGIGAIFETRSKKDVCYVKREELEKICERVKIPVVAIGGINKENINLLAGINLAGFAMIKAIFGGENIKNRCEELILRAREIIGENS